MAVVDAVQLRLDETEPRLRRNTLFIAEAASRFVVNDLPWSELELRDESRDSANCLSTSRCVSTGRAAAPCNRDQKPSGI